MDLEAAKGDKRRQVKATNCDKFIAAFCRFLSLGFEPRFFQTISLGDGVSVQMEFPRVHFNAFSPTAATFLLPLFMVLARLHLRISVVVANYLASFFEAR